MRLLLGLVDINLVVNELMQGKNRASQATNKDHGKVISGANSQRLLGLLVVDIGEEVENVLEGVVDLVADG